LEATVVIEKKVFVNFQELELELRRADLEEGKQADRHEGPDMFLIVKVGQNQCINFKRILMHTRGEGVSETLGEPFGQEDGIGKFLKMFIFKMFIQVMEPVVNISPFSALFELLELGLDVFFKMIYGR
jgi:hypothetical protein